MPAQTRKITVDTFALFLGRAVGLLLGMVRLNFLARYLGLSNFGILNSAIFFVSLFLPVFDLGISQILTREIVRKPDQGNRLLGQAILLKVFIAVASSILVIGLAVVSPFDRNTIWAVVLTTIAIAINSMSTAYLSAFQAYRKMVTVSLVTMFADLALSVVLIVMLPMMPLMSTVLLCTIAVAVINMVFLVMLYRRSLGKLIMRMNSSDWLSMILGGLPIAVSSFCAAVYMYVSPNILKYARGDIEVGIYGAGYKLISVFLLIPTVLSQVLYPLFSEFHAHSRHKLGKALDDALRVTFEISLPLAVGTVVLAPAIIAFLFPPEYAGSATVLRAIIIGNVVGYQAWVLYAFQLATGNQKFCMWNSLIVAVLVTATSFGVVPRFGYVGVALIVGGTDVILFINHAIYAKHLGYSIIKPGIVVRVMSSSTLMFIVVWYLRNQFLPVPIIAGMLVYGVALYFSGSIGEQERSIIGKIMRRVGMGN